MLQETWRWYGPNDPVTLEDLVSRGFLDNRGFRV